MEFFQTILEDVKSLVPAAAAVIVVIIVLVIFRLIAERRSGGIPGGNFRRQWITLLIVFVGILAVVILLPISDSLRGQLLTLIGILITAAIALSSATFVGNAMAGFMLRAVGSFRSGDFIRVGEIFGRVSERGLFHVEIQTEDRDLTTLPNLYLVTNPVKVIRSSGTIISAEVSLGYDVPHSVVERLLTDAATEAKLQEPFVQILALGDFSVTYRAAGLLPEVKHVITARSRLRAAMLDNLHRGGVEIVSPTFMNTRALAEGWRVIPRLDRPEKGDGPARAVAEKVAFDKAELAESLEKLQEKLAAAAGEIEALKAGLTAAESEEERERLKAEIESLEKRRAWLADYIRQREEEKGD